MKLHIKDLNAAKSSTFTINIGYNKILKTLEELEC